MLIKITYVALAVLFCSQASAIVKPPKKISVRLQLEPGADSPEHEIWKCNLSPKRNISEKESIYRPNVTKTTSWEFHANEPIGISVIHNNGFSYLVMLKPGADVSLNLTKEKLMVTGPGSETFTAHYEEIIPQYNALTTPKAKQGKSFTNMEEFYEWNTYLDKKSEIVHRVINKHSKNSPSEIWDILKVNLLAEIENRRCEKFLWLSSDRKKLHLSKSNIDSIYHSVIFSKDLQWLLLCGKENPSMEYYYRFVTTITEQLRPSIDPNNAFFYSHDGYQERLKTIFRVIDSLATGPMKEQLAAYVILTKIGRAGQINVADEFLPLAFSMINNPELRNYIKQELAAYARAYASTEVRAFHFRDVDGKLVTHKDMELKTLIFHINGPESVNPDPLFQAAIQEFKDNPEVILAEISYGLSFSEWQQKVSNDSYKKNAIWHLYSPQTGDHIDFIHNIHSIAKVPTLAFYQYQKRGAFNYIPKSSRFKAILSKNGNDSTAAILTVVRNEAGKFDGPYIRTIRDTTFVYSVAASRLKTDTLSDAGPSAVDVATGIGAEPFHVKINASPSIPPTSYPMPGKALFLSDLEGNFDTFREFLIKQKVMDSLYNWTFGEGHLIISGDVFDRGRKVTGCLWLIYMLENKAKEAGGFVHYILGNHEVMNLTGGQNKYVYPDYRTFAERFGLEYADLFDKTSVLGKWLRTKNIMEVIGDNLVVHGGISPEINALALSADEINHKHRSFLAGNAVAPNDTATAKILSSKYSPYWYRGYYKSDITGKISTEDNVNRTLQLYRVNRIITGHTVVKDVAGFYGGKVINTDTHHASGDSEGLLIEKGSYYRIDINGLKEKINK